MSRYSLMMLPGLDGTGIMFRPIIKELEAEVDPIVISYKQENECNYPALVDEVANYLPENDFFILGESFSGPIAIMLAGRKPKGLKGIILCATFITNPSSIFPSFLSFLIRAPLFYVWPVSLKVNIITGGHADDEIKELMKEAKEKFTNKALAARTRETLKVDVTEELKQCECPVLYLKGARDLIVGGQNLGNIKRIKKDVLDVTLDTSHLVLQEAPHDSAKKILKFIRTVT